MKTTKIILSTLTIAAVLAAPFAGLAEDKKEAAKPYPLKTCVVSGEKLGEMGDAYVFTQDGQEIKMCCKGCLKDFKKDTAKYMKKIQDAEKSAKEKPAK